MHNNNNSFTANKLRIFLKQFFSCIRLSTEKNKTSYNFLNTLINFLFQQGFEVNSHIFNKSLSWTSANFFGANGY